MKWINSGKIFFQYWSCSSVVKYSVCFNVIFLLKREKKTGLEALLILHEVIRPRPPPACSRMTGEKNTETQPYVWDLLVHTHPKTVFPFLFSKKFTSTPAHTFWCKSGVRGPTHMQYSQCRHASSVLTTQSDTVVVHIQCDTHAASALNVMRWDSPYQQQYASLLSLCFPSPLMLWDSVRLRRRVCDQRIVSVANHFRAHVAHDISYIR